MRTLMDYLESTGKVTLVDSKPKVHITLMEYLDRTGKSLAERTYQVLKDYSFSQEDWPEQIEAQERFERKFYKD